ncbi:ATP-binding protein [Lysinibacillus sp. NPDC056185]|uniref:ATP-binding protein n=1 Tax=Lysinibacillus sp. NPDC056185 TaxID=3345739 RepID=UPI0039EEE386
MERKRSAESTIAGYLYQFDKTIIELIKQEDNDTVICVEGIEDIDIENINELDNTSVQVKYYAKTTYNTSEIKEPIQQMFKHFKEVIRNNFNRRNYYLYAYFKEETEKLKLDANKNLISQGEKSALDFLKDDILTTRNIKGEVVTQLYIDSGVEIPEEDLKEFIRLLKVDLEATDIHLQYNEVLSLLNEKIDNCKDLEEAENYYYNNALKVIFNKAIQICENGEALEEKHKELKQRITSVQGKIKYREKCIRDGKGEKEKHTDDLHTFKIELQGLIEELESQDYIVKAQEKHKEKRKITKEEFLNEIDKKALLFNKWFAWHRGKDNYYDYVIEKLKSTKGLSKTKSRYLYIGKDYLANKEGEISFSDFISNVIEDSFALNEALSKHKVWTVVLDLKSDEISLLKRELLTKNIQFNDGNESWQIFDADKFNREPIVYVDQNSAIKQAEYQIKIISANTFINRIQEINHIDVVICFGESTLYKSILDKSDATVYAIEDTKDIKTLSDISKIFTLKNRNNKFFRILSVSPSCIQVEVTDPDKFRNLNDKFTIGSYIKITDEFEESVVGVLKNYKIRDINDYFNEINIKKQKPTFILDIHPIGYIHNNEFYRGSNNITVPPNHVEIVDNELLKRIFHQEIKENEFYFSSLPQALSTNSKAINVVLDGNKFFNKHLAVIGSTGSGKSCTVAKILHEGINPFTVEQKEGLLNNSHIIIFDIHGEYQHSFKDKCRALTVDDIKLPYWLMNSEELEDFFLDVEGSDHNQRNIFKRAVVLNKKFYNKGTDGEFKDEITYDTPVYFNIKEVLQYIKNYNIAKEANGLVVFKKGTEHIYDDFENQKSGSIFEELEEAEKKIGDINTTKSTTFNGKFTGFVNRLETKINDDRLKFLLNKGDDYRINLADIIKQFIGYKFGEEGSIQGKKNVVIIDLSGMPFEIINNCVSLVSRLIFNFAFHRKKIRKEEDVKIPFLLVYEEAHNYIPKSTEAKYKYVKESVERVAKEGRKYGVSVMIVSQRPSEISETIFSQCNSFVVMRVTNPNDQQYIKKLLPDDVSSLTDSLSSFKQREALIIGEAIPMPAVVEINKLDSNQLPKSNDVKFIQEWRRNWDSFSEFDEVINSLIGN